MLRENIIKTSLGKDAAFRWRGHEISRVEGLSDAVFGFAVTLLVVSLEVPKTFNELAEIMRALPLRDVRAVNDLSRHDRFLFGRMP